MSESRDKFKRLIDYSTLSLFSDMFICNFRFSRRPFGAIFWANLTPYSSSSPSIFRANLHPNWTENGKKTKKTNVEKMFFAQVNVTETLGKTKQKQTNVETKIAQIHVHPTRRIVYSASFSRNFRGSFWGCATLFGDYLGVIWEVFCEDFEGKTIQRVNAKTGKTVFFTI